MNNKCDACNQEVTVSEAHIINSVHKFMAMKYSLPKLFSKLPAQLHPQIRKLESLFATLGKEFSDLESCQKELNSLTDKFIREKGGNENKNTLNFTFCKTCGQELESQHAEVEKVYSNKYSGEEREELERKIKEIDEGFEKFRTEIVEKIGQEKFNQIGQELENELLAERERERETTPTIVPLSLTPENKLIR